MATIFSDRGRCTVIFLPLKSLHEQYMTRAKDAGIKCEVWSVKSVSGHPPQWLIVQIDRCDPEKRQTLESLKLYLQSLITNQRLARVLVDEGHLILTQDGFRPVMHHVAWLAGLSVNLVVMTATLPVACEQTLMARLGCHVYRVLRQPSTRPNIVYAVHPTPSESLNQAVSDHYWTCLSRLQHGEVIIIFCLSKLDVEYMAQELEIPSYHSDHPSDKLEEVLAGLRSGVYHSVVATSLLSVGFDVPSVRYVIHRECPRSIVDYEQESGRAGRDGQPAYADIFADVDRCRSHPPLEDLFGVQAMRNTVRDPNMCRRVRAGHILNGAGSNCPAIEGALFCDVCQSQRNDPSRKPFKSDYPPDLALYSIPRREFLCFTQGFG